jgi:hypothetical protein
MRRFIPVLALALLGAKLPDNVVTLPAAEPIRLCSRAQPAGVTGRRQPTEAEVLAAEKELPAYTARLGGEMARTAKGARRQYLGIMLGDRPALYLNVFLPVGALIRPEMPPDVREHLARQDREWLTGFVGVCDGGPAFWGAVYHPDTNQFDDFQSNGYA